MKIYGYARVSSQSQNLDRQIIQLRKYVPEDNIIVDKASGKDTNREGYLALKGALGLRKGDVLYVTALDRLSRNKNDIRAELEWFHNQGVRLMVLDLPTTLIEVPDNQKWILEMINNILIEVLSSIAQQERETILRRQREGIEAAKRKKRHLGRPKAEFPQDWEKYYIEWKNGEITAVKMMQELGLKRSTFYKLAKEYNAKYAVTDK